jgi:hypothetical protein
VEGKGRGLICIIPSLGMCLERGLLVASCGHFSDNGSISVASRAV